MDISFRKIDIDQYDEDVLLESELYEPDPRDPAQVLDDTKQKTATVRTALSRGDVTGALNIILEGAPYGPNVDEAKNLTLQTLVSILNSTKSTEIPGVVRSLSPDAQDTLMKYLYKGMALPGWGDLSGSVLLGWHEKLTEVAGTGCIHGKSTGGSSSTSLLLRVPSESLTHITSFLNPPTLFVLSCTNKELYAHVKDDNTWRRAYVYQYLGISPESDLHNDADRKSLMLRREESTWRKEFVKDRLFVVDTPLLRGSRTVTVGMWFVYGEHAPLPFMDTTYVWRSARFDIGSSRSLMMEHDIIPAVSSWWSGINSAITQRNFGSATQLQQELAIFFSSHTFGDQLPFRSLVKH
ncbi:uncharacterized protein FIBRA_01858 [Fibroporia radiculosa]|uniref:Actin-related protein 2/3 complex subunit 5 n=1 Tax=Fibroporia radiculosa TaxID=599839 RepID=J4H1H7_9APHY|nr:uncharacterized protein FIBRA_01858 [Fibroporia radiculosa]CCL99834.1 predicted protein [Fibroporia radiculosa]